MSCTLLSPGASKLQVDRNSFRKSRRLQNCGQIISYGTNSTGCMRDYLFAIYLANIHIWALHLGYIAPREGFAQDAGWFDSSVAKFGRLLAHQPVIMLSGEAANISMFSHHSCTVIPSQWRLPPFMYDAKFATKILATGGSMICFLFKTFLNCKVWDEGKP